MFFSADLLSKRSPLGAIWMVAHGKKLSKHKLMGISVQDICNEVMHPEVPHSLRLQGILVGGVVVVFSKQQNYLWEDVQEMMKRVKDAMNTQPVVQAKATLKQGKAAKNKVAQQTLLDEEDLMLDELNNALAQGAGVPFGLNMPPLTQRQLGMGLGMPVDLTQMQESDLFAAPAMSSRTQGTGVTGSTHGGLSGGAVPVGAAQGRRRAFNPLAASEEDPNELFAMAGAGDDLLLADELAGLGPSGLDEHLNDLADLHQPMGSAHGGQPEPEGDRSGSRAGSKATTGTTANGSSKGQSLVRCVSAAEPSAPTEEDMERDLDLLADGSKGMSPVGQEGQEGREGELLAEEEMEVPLNEAEQQQESASRQAATEALRSKFESQDQEVLASEEEEEEAHKRRGRAAQGRAKASVAAGPNKVVTAKRKAKAIALPLDDPEEMLVRAKEFREWTMDTSALVFRRPEGGRARTAPTALAADQPGAGALPELTLMALASAGGLLPQRLGSELPAGLLAGAPSHVRELGRLRVGAQLHALREQCLRSPPSCVDMDRPDAQLTKKGSKRAKRRHASPERAHQRNVDAPRATTEGPAQHPELEDSQQHPMAMDEMQDILHDLPFGGDVEVERLRAASMTPGGSGLLPSRVGSELGSGAAQLLAQAGGVRGSVLNTGQTSSHNSSMLGSIPIRGRAGSMGPGDAPSSGLLLPGSGKLPGSSARHTGTSSRGLGSKGNSSALLRWGTATLEDLVPDLGMGLCDITLRADTGSAGNSAPHGLSARGLLAASAGSSHGALCTGPLGDGTEHIQLMETSGHGTASQGLSELSNLSNKNSVTVVRLLQRLLSEKKVSGAADPTVSFFDLAQRLTRTEAVKLFMQVLVTQTACYTHASQEEAYGDIIIRSGRRMHL